MNTRIITITVGLLIIGAATWYAFRTPALTSAEVARHASAQDCWSIVNGNVYDLTSWIAHHPGGEQVILAVCGKDGSPSFNRHQAEHGAEAEAHLETFKVGPLVNE
jgi:cytochrome b involved in lipid metabolism